MGIRSVIIGVLVVTAGGGAALSITGGGGTTITCNQTAANSTQLGTAITAASAGQTVCLTAAVSYGTFTGTTKAITIIDQAATGSPSPVAATMTLNLSGSSANFTLDGGLVHWNSATALSINGGNIASGTSNVTLKNFKSTGAGRLWNFLSPDAHTNLVIDHAYFHDVTSGEAILYMDCSCASPGTSTGVTVKNSLFYHSSADAIKMANDGAMTVSNNKFEDLQSTYDTCSPFPSCSNHTDAIQFFPGSGSHVRGNWFDNAEQCSSGFDGMDTVVVEHNLYTNCGAHWITTMQDSPASTVRYNTIGDTAGAIYCYSKDNTSPVSVTSIQNNVARNVALDGGTNRVCTPSVNDHNLVDSGASAGNINGTPVWSGGTTPTTFAGYCLSGSSPGFTGSTVGGQVGLCGGDYSSVTDGPPTGEGF